MAPSIFAEMTKQSPPSIQRAYVTLYITGSSHTLHSVCFAFSHTNTDLSIGAIDHSNHLSLARPDRAGRNRHAHIDPFKGSSDSANIQPKSTT